MIIKVNFGSESSATSDDFILDTGVEYSADRGYGWITQSSLDAENSAPIDISSNSRDRAIDDDDPTTDSLIHLQYPTDLVSPIAATSNKTPSAWEYDIANGSYLVTVGVGDPKFTDSNHVVNVEGQSVIDNFVPTEDLLFTEDTALIEVTDGKLTVDAVGGDNTKLTFVEIISNDGEDTSIDSGDTEDDFTDSSDTEDGQDTSIDSGETEDGEDTPVDSNDADDNQETPVDSGDIEDDSTDLNDADDSDFIDTGDIEDGQDTPVDSGDTEDGEDTVKINFGVATVFPPEGYIQDIGGEYNTEKGFGWITQDSVDSENPTPIDISPNTRDRNSVEEETFDSLIHLQYADAFAEQNTIRTPAAWEYELANGEYQVTVSVGDPDFVDSNHVVNVEGNSIISGFVPTQEQLFTVETTTVEVTDGKLTIDAIGGENTKINFVEITPADSSEDGSEVVPPIDLTPVEIPGDAPIPIEGGRVVEMVEAVEGGINVNFGVATIDSASGFIQDVGAAYSSDRGYGWITQDSARSDNPTPIDVFANGRDRNTLFNDGQGSFFQEPTRDSLIHLQYPTGLPNSADSVTNPVAWEYELANGQYQVTVGVGDPDFFDSNHVINVEGESVISGFVPTGFEVNGFLPLGEQAFSVGTATVEVNDGKLTFDAIGGENTKINYISIVPIDDI